MNDFQFAILPMIHADGSTQMGIDLALLDHSHDSPNTIWFRTYTWSEPTLSLGYFQAWNDLPELMKKPWINNAVVRRPTGGGAIWHDEDLTYSVVIPSKHPWASNSRRMYQGIHDALAELMREDGAGVLRRQEYLGSGKSSLPFEDESSGHVQSETGSGNIRQRSPFLCFEDGDADDLVYHGTKIVGGAQRRRSWGTLQHGSIHWQCSGHPAACQLPGLLDLCPDFMEKSRIVWGSSVGKRLAERWNVRAVQQEIPAAVVLSAHAWSNRLKQDDWLLKR